MHALVVTCNHTTLLKVCIPMCSASNHEHMFVDVIVFLEIYRELNAKHMRCSIYYRSERLDNMFAHQEKE